MKPRRLKKILARVERGRWPKRGSKTAKRFQRWCRRMVVLLADLYPLTVAWLTFFATVT
jgi:hypothetical protein